MKTRLKAGPTSSPREPRRRKLNRPWFVLSVAVAALVSGTGTVALAAIPDVGTGVFHGCYSQSSGALRVVDPSANQTCRTNEKAITWDQSGISWMGAWDPDTSYAVDDAVEYDGSSYIATAANIRRPPSRSPSTWGTLASQGAPGQSGTNGTTILNGSSRPPTSGFGVAPGDFYLDTATEVLWGPAVITCVVRKCSAQWGNGTALVGAPGAPGPAGSEMSYETKIGSLDSSSGVNPGVNLPSGASERILTQTLPTGGDFQVTATLVLYHSTFNSSDSGWQCALVAANPNGPTVTLDISVMASSALYAPMTLEGDVSLAPGAFVGVNCREYEAKEADEVSFAHIISTQLSGFTEIVPG
jgi:hypothetical protein